MTSFFGKVFRYRSEECRGNYHPNKS